jgi:hypothetical protein
LMDLIGFSGENATHLALRSAYTAMISASPYAPEKEG